MLFTMPDKLRAFLAANADPNAAASGATAMPAAPLAIHTPDPLARFRTAAPTDAPIPSAIPEVVPEGVVPGYKPPTMSAMPALPRQPIPAPQPPETKFTPPPGYADNKPKWWERLLGGLTAAAMAYGGNPRAAEIGSGVTNRRYLGAMADWEGKHANEVETAKQGERQYENLLDLYRNAQSMDLRERQLEEEKRRNDDRRAYEGEVTTAKNEANALKRQLAEGKAEASTPEARRKLADEYGLKGAERFRFILTGQMSQPREPREPRARSQYEDAYDAFVRENGRQPNADEVANLGRPANNRIGAIPTFRDKQSIDRFSSDWYARQRKEKRLERHNAWQEEGGVTADKDKLQRRYQEIDDDYKDTFKQFEDLKKQWYADVSGRGAGRGTTGKPVSAGGPPASSGVIRVRNKATGETGTIPANRLKDALASGKYEQVQ